MIRAIIFDCFGVLTTDLWKEFVASLPEDQQSSASSLNHALDAGMVSHQDFFEAIHKSTGRLPKEVEETITTELHKNVPLLGYIAELKKDYKIGLLSNVSTDWITREFLSAEERALFTDMVFSYQVGITKPDSGVYQLTADRLGEKPEDCVLIDDSELNCNGAEKTGMKAIKYDNFETLKSQLKSMLK